MYVRMNGWMDRSVGRSVRSFNEIMYIYGSSEIHGNVAPV